MKWIPGQRSENLEDRRDEDTGYGGGGFGGGGFGGGFRPGGVRVGLGGAAVLLVLSLVFGRNFFSGLDGGPPPPPQVNPGGARHAPGGTGAAARHPRSAAEEHLVDFVSFVLDDVQGLWKRELPRQASTPYPDARLVLFRNVVRSGCGFAETAMGPFYCPADSKVYIDLAFYQELRTRFGAPGEFAQAYVIAHEVGHHVQDVLGIEARVRRAQRERPRDANRLSVRMELQADCLAGVWGHSTRGRDILEPGDLESGLAAAAAVGDDRLQRHAGARVNPERWTHGSSAERVAWFKRGFETGQLSACDTFNQPDPATP